MLLSNRNTGARVIGPLGGRDQLYGLGWFGERVLRILFVDCARELHAMLHMYKLKFIFSGMST